MELLKLVLPKRKGNRLRRIDELEEQVDRLQTIVEELAQNVPKQYKAELKKQAPTMVSFLEDK